MKTFLLKLKYRALVGEIFEDFARVPFTVEELDAKYGGDPKRFRIHLKDPITRGVLEGRGSAKPKNKKHRNPHRVYQFNPDFVKWWGIHSSAIMEAL